MPGNDDSNDPKKKQPPVRVKKQPQFTPGAGILPGPLGAQETSPSAPVMPNQPPSGATLTPPPELDDAVITKFNEDFYKHLMALLEACKDGQQNPIIDPAWFKKPENEYKQTGTTLNLPGFGTIDIKPEIISYTPSMPGTKAANEDQVLVSVLEAMAKSFAAQGLNKSQWGITVNATDEQDLEKYREALAKYNKANPTNPLRFDKVIIKNEVQPDDVLEKINNECSVGGVQAKPKRAPG